MNGRSGAAGSGGTERKSPEDYLRSGQTIQIRPIGWSMYPLLIPGRDWAVIRPVQDPRKELRKGDAALYRREDGRLVLHRIWKAEDDAFTFLGDNQTEPEPGIRPAQILGKMEGFVRSGKKHSVRECSYRLYVRLWAGIRPLRKCWHCIRRVIGRKGPDRQ